MVDVLSDCGIKLFLTVAIVGQKHIVCWGYNKSESHESEILNLILNWAFSDDNLIYFWKLVQNFKWALMGDVTITLSFQSETETAAAC